VKSGAELVRAAREVTATAALPSPALDFRFMPADNGHGGELFRIPGLSRDVATQATGELGVLRVGIRYGHWNSLIFSSFQFLLSLFFVH
jgi:hypothetical protein